VFYLLQLDLIEKLETIMLEEGVVMQPYWHPLYNHNHPHVKGVGMHPTFDKQIDKIGLNR